MSVHHCLIVPVCMTGNPTFLITLYSEISLTHEESNALAHLTLVKFVI